MTLSFRVFMGLVYALLITLICAGLAAMMLLLQLRSSVQVMQADTSGVAQEFHVFIGATITATSMQMDHLATMERGLLLQQKQLNSVMRATSHSINDPGGVLPELANTLRAINQQVTDLGGSAKAGLDSAKLDLDRLDPILQNFNQLVTDPSIKQSLKNVEAGTQSLAEGTEHMNKTLAHVEGMAADAQNSLHHKLHPSKKELILGGTWTLLKLASTHIPF
jgi:ABC-type transporter Mla subunit MlaD